MAHQPELGRLQQPRPDRGHWQAQTGYPDRQGPARAAQVGTRWPHAASDAACCPTICNNSFTSAVCATFVQPKCRLPEGWPRPLKDLQRETTGVASVSVSHRLLPHCWCC